MSLDPDFQAPLNAPLSQRVTAARTKVLPAVDLYVLGELVHAATPVVINACLPPCLHGSDLPSVHHHWTLKTLFSQPPDTNHRQSSPGTSWRARRGVPDTPQQYSPQQTLFRFCSGDSCEQDLVTAVIIWIKKLSQSRMFEVDDLLNLLRDECGCSVHEGWALLRMTPSWQSDDLWPFVSSHAWHGFFENVAVTH